MISMFGARKGELSPVSIWLIRRCRLFPTSSTFFTSSWKALRGKVSGVLLNEVLRDAVLRRREAQVLRGGKGEVVLRRKYGIKCG